MAVQSSVSIQREVAEVCAGRQNRRHLETLGYVSPLDCRAGADYDPGFACGFFRSNLLRAGERSRGCRFQGQPLMAEDARSIENLGIRASDDRSTGLIDGPQSMVAGNAFGDGERDGGGGIEHFSVLRFSLERAENGIGAGSLA